MGEGVDRLGDHQCQADVSAAQQTCNRSHDNFGNLLSGDLNNPLTKTNFTFSDLGVAQCRLERKKPKLALKTCRDWLSSDSAFRLRKSLFL